MIEEIAVKNFLTPRLLVTPSDIIIFVTPGSSENVAVLAQCKKI